jgi:hypothetical protein
VVEWPARIPTPFVSAVPCSTLDVYLTVLAATGADLGRMSARVWNMIRYFAATR